MQSKHRVDPNSVITLDHLPKSIFEMNENFRKINISVNKTILILNGMKNNLTVSHNYGRVIVNGIENHIKLLNDYTGSLEVTGYDNKIDINSSITSDLNENLSEISETCVICLNKYKVIDSDIAILRCNHILHQSCLLEYSRHYSRCPICKEDFL